jgi:hypothetical protein
MVAGVGRLQVRQWSRPSASDSFSCASVIEDLVQLVLSATWTAGEGC